MSPSIHTISVRGTMTSLTMVSPSSKTWWIMRRSPASMRSDASAMSTISRSSASELNGPSVNPLPGVTRLPRMISTCGIGPTTVVRAEMSPTVRRATASACCRPSVRAATPSSTNDTMVMGAIV